MDKKAPLSRDQEIRIGNAVQAFHTIYHLAMMIEASIATAGEVADEANILQLAIRDIAAKHGYVLDRSLGTARLGVFDETEGASHA